MRSEATQRGAALLWDESFLWGVMARKALLAGGLRHDLVCSEDIRKGRLGDYRMIFVPGGWASNKVKALGDGGVDAIRQFVRNGGTYLGFCGGAGLASEDGIGLLPVKRRPTKERVPSFSGRIRVNTSDHPLWQNITDPVFHAWWPSQFVVGRDVSVLATYGEALPDSFSSDVNVGDAAAAGKWPELERIYQINLDPRRMEGEPAVIEGTYGKGKVLLSLVHFDTPDDPPGAAMLKNIWKEFICGCGPTDVPAHQSRNEQLRTDRGLSELEAAVDGLIDLGIRNFLWFQRKSLLLQWRRGVRGLEYGTLSVMIREIAEQLRMRDRGRAASGLDEALERIRKRLLPFVDKARDLLVRERLLLQQGPITYERCDDREVQVLREELFSRSKSHGGLFKELLDEMDGLLYRVMTQ